MAAAVSSFIAVEPDIQAKNVVVPQSPVVIASANIFTSMADKRTLATTPRCMPSLAMNF